MVVVVVVVVVTVVVVVIVVVVVTVGMRESLLPELYEGVYQGSNDDTDNK